MSDERREQLAKALCDTDAQNGSATWDEADEQGRDDYRRMADTALRFMAKEADPVGRVDWAVQTTTYIGGPFDEVRTRADMYGPVFTEEAAHEYVARRRNQYGDGIRVVRREVSDWEPNDAGEETS